jgi:lipopolysaccharide cholinephosphotransferase
MVKLEKNFLQEEDRDGFHISTLMKSAWAAQLKILQQVDEICRENNLTYTADWGTLLGAVRHGGFIPWDDDIDICMMRQEYQKLEQLVEGREDIKCMSIYTDPEHGLYVNRIINGTYFTTDRDEIKKHMGFPFPIGVDVFLIDYVPREKVLEEEQLDVLKTINQAVNINGWLKENDSTNAEYNSRIIEKNKCLEKIKKVCNIEFIEDDPSDQELLVLYEEVSGLYGDNDSDYLTQVACLGVGMDYYLPKDTYKKIIYMKFENLEIPVPYNYDEILKKKYGEDYMVPKNVGAGHEYPFYKQMIKEIYPDMQYKKAEKYIEDLSVGFYKKFLEKTPKCYFGEEDKLDPKELARLEIIAEINRIATKANIKIYEQSEDNYLADTLDYYFKTNNIDELRKVVISIKREDVDSFISVLQVELSPWFSYKSIFTDQNYTGLKIDVYSDGYECELEELKKRFHGYTENLNVPIAILYGISDDIEKENTRKMLVDNLCLTAKSMLEIPPYNMEILDIVGQWQKIANITIDLTKNLRNEFYLAADKIAKSCPSDRVCRYQVYE